MAKKVINKRCKPEQTPEDQPLTAVEDAFVDQYLIDMNGGLAWQRARNGGIKIESARVQASKALKQPNVIKALNERRQRKKERCEIEQDRVLQELARMAFYNIADFVEWSNSNVKLRPSMDLDREQTAAIHEVAEGKFGVSIKMASKEKSLELLMKHLGMLKEKHELSGPDGKTIGFEAVYDQVSQKILQQVNGSACGIPRPVGHASPFERTPDAHEDPKV